MESTFHLGILRERPDVNVVLHFQSEYATAISCMKNKPTNFNVTAEIPCHVGSDMFVSYHDCKDKLFIIIVTQNRLEKWVFRDIGAISYGHIGQDLITLASMLRIPVCMHNVEEDEMFRPAAWNAFGMDKEGADYRACATYGPIYK